MLRQRTSDYQDFGQGGRDCELRYEAIKAHLPADRAITVLDVGSNMGFFSLAIARDFQLSVVHSVEHRKADLLFHIRRLHDDSSQNNYLYRSLLDKQIVSKLFSGAHVFDVTLLLSVTHHFHYPFEEWSQIVGRFVRHSALTFFELPSLHDDPDIAALEKFRSWYSRFSGNHYEELLRAMLSAASIKHCRLQTIRGSAQTSSSKDSRHLIVVSNPSILMDKPRFHCLAMAETPGLFVEHPACNHWNYKVHHFRLWRRQIPGRIRGRIRRFYPFA